MHKNVIHTGFLLIAHGSRRADSNLEVVNITKKLSLALQCPVASAFLELTEPDFEAAFAELLSQGCNEVIVLPYFLAAGRHLVEDVPQKVSQCRQIHPEVTIKLAPHIGAAHGMTELLASMANDAIVCE